MRVAYVNGRYVAHADAVVHVEDRGFQFADSIYEVWAVLDGRLADVPTVCATPTIPRSDLSSTAAPLSVPNASVAADMVDCSESVRERTDRVRPVPQKDSPKSPGSMSSFGRLSGSSVALPCSDLRSWSSSRHTDCPANCSSSFSIAAGDMMRCGM